MSEESEKKSMKWVDLKEFINEGYLQELNRRFLHPLGMALAFSLEESGEIKLKGVQDYRDDPEGMSFGVFSSEELKQQERLRKKQNVDKLWAERESSRVEALGFMVQPL